MNALTRRRGMMAAQKRSLLPPEYQQVEWIGGERYGFIRSNFTVDIAIKTPIKAVAKVLIPSFDIDVETYWLSLGVSQMTRGLGGYRKTGRIYAYSGASSVLTDAPLDTPITVEGEWTSDGKQYLRYGSSEAVTATGSRVQSNSFVNLFGTNRGVFTGKIYYALVEIDGARIFEAIPCYRRSDSAVGVFDTVHGTFYSDSFTKGADVN